METIQNIWGWVADNGPELATAVLAVYGAAALIVKLTPTNADNEFFSKWVTPWMSKLEQWTNKQKPAA